VALLSTDRARRRVGCECHGEASDVTLLILPVWWSERNSGQNSTYPKLCAEHTGGAR